MHVEGMTQRACAAECQVGKTPHPAGGVPAGCRFGREPPECFSPREIVSPGPSEAQEEVDVELLISAVNVEWDKHHGFKLFDLVSFEPLRYLRGECRDAGDYHNRVVGLGELMEKINEDAMRTRLPEAEGGAVPRKHTIRVLERFLVGCGYQSAGAVVAKLRSVQQLRNLPPTHPGDEGGRRGLAELQRMGFSVPVVPQEWPRVWRATVGQFAQALELLLGDLRQDGPGPGRC